MQYSFNAGEIWKTIPAWKTISRDEFSNYKWQLTNCFQKINQLPQLLDGRLSETFYKDVEAGAKLAPMNIRITPYIFSLINWDEPYTDPLRRQFLPVKSDFLADHPLALNDSLAEDHDSPVPELVHRYPDKVLFLPLTVCPVYCTFCTRSRLIGGSTASKEKTVYGPDIEKWAHVFDYLRAQEEVEDVVISGGDTYLLSPKFIDSIGKTLLDIPHIRRIRFATKGLAVLPMRITSDEHWVAAIKSVYEYGRERGKHVCIHTHFNHPAEITQWTVDAMQKLFSIGVTVRNQSVLLAGVNDNFTTLYQLIKYLCYINITPYYIYLHDMVPGCEHLRTTLKEAVLLEALITGTTSGYNIPKIICDLPGGGGKHYITSYLSYNEKYGISEWEAVNVKPDKKFYYFDPIHKLSKDAQLFWSQPQAANFENIMMEAANLDMQEQLLKRVGRR